MTPYALIVFKVAFSTSFDGVFGRKVRQTLFWVLSSDWTLPSFLRVDLVQSRDGTYLDLIGTWLNLIGI